MISGLNTSLPTLTTYYNRIHGRKKPKSDLELSQMRDLDVCSKLHMFVNHLQFLREGETEIREKTTKA